MWMKVRKWAALIFSGFSSTIMFAIGSIYYGFLGGIGFMFAGLLLGVVAGNILLNNPFRAMVEGKGIMVLNIDSTGRIQPFIVRVLPPYIRGRLFKKQVKDVFDRSAVMQLAPPIEGKQAGHAQFVYEENHNRDTETKVLGDGSVADTVDQQGNRIINIKLTEGNYNRGRFALSHFPCLIYNEQISSIVTKDFMSDTEKLMFAEHQILYLNRITEELSERIRDFARHVVENYKPNQTGTLLQNKWFWIIVIGLFVILAILFGPELYKTLVGSVGTASSGLQGAMDGATVAVKT